MAVEEVVAWIDALVMGLPGRVGIRGRDRWLRARVAGLGARSRVAPGLVLAGGRGICIGEDLSAMRNCSLRAEQGSLVIGNRVSLNANVSIHASDGGEVRIGDDVLVGPNVVIRAADHVHADTGRPIRDQGHMGGVIRVADDVWLGAAVVVLPGVVIGRGAIVAAGAVVTSEVEECSVVGGVPARLLARR